MKVYAEGLGGPYVVGGMEGVSIADVIRLALMVQDMCYLMALVAYFGSADEKKYFDNLPQTEHARVGARIGLGTKPELRHHTKGYQYALAMGNNVMAPEPVNLGVPHGSVQGVQAGNTCALPMTAVLNAEYARNV